MQDLFIYQRKNDNRYSRALGSLKRSKQYLLQLISSGYLLQLISSRADTHRREYMRLSSGTEENTYVCLPPSEWNIIQLQNSKNDFHPKILNLQN